MQRALLFGSPVLSWITGGLAFLLIVLASLVIGVIKLSDSVPEPMRAGAATDGVDSFAAQVVARDPVGAVSECSANECINAAQSACAAPSVSTQAVSPDSSTTTVFSGPVDGSGHQVSTSPSAAPPQKLRMAEPTSKTTAASKSQSAVPPRVSQPAPPPASTTRKMPSSGL